MAAASVPGLAGCSGTAGKQTALKDVKWPVLEGPDTPKLCVGGGGSEQAMKDIKQMGVDYVLGGGGRTPWTVEGLREAQNRYSAFGLTMVCPMIGGINNCIYGKPGRDEEIEVVKQSIIAAGAVGIPVVEWNWYIDRLNEAYFYKEGRGGSGVTAVDYHRPIDTLNAPYNPDNHGIRVKDLPTRPGIDKYSAGQLWDNVTYFVNAIIPTAEKAGVRMALHPNDPPMPISKGNPQIISGFDGWKRLLDIAKTPFHGMTFDPGVAFEMGLNPIEVMRMMGNQMNHSHWRNVITYEPYNVYDEVFFDVGQVNMFAVMKEYLNIGYKLYIYPEHERYFTRDGEPGQTRIGGYPGGGGTSGMIYNVAYARAMLQAAMSV
jgi:mannonate dehydratase